MLYKKIHRQYVRKFRKGRKYMFPGGGIVHEITKKPYLAGDSIWVDGWCLIALYSGKCDPLRKDYVIWLN